MEITIIVISFLVSILTFFSGFGLGTILTPVFMIFFPVEVSIALTAIVHFSNNVFKFFLVGKSFDKKVLLNFGIPAIIAAFMGSWLLLQLGESQPFFTYTLFGHFFQVYLVKFSIAILLLFFACFEIIPCLKKLEFDSDKLPIGGFLSGFFGGLSGVQGAFRSAFLVRVGLSKEKFIATTIALSLLVDISRLSVYSTQIIELDLTQNINIIIYATLSAILGALIGNKLLKKVTITFIQNTVAIALIMLSICLGAGII